MNYQLTTVEGFVHPKDLRSYVVEIFNTPDTVSLYNQVSQFMLPELGPNPGVGPLVGTYKGALDGTHICWWPNKIWALEHKSFRSFILLNSGVVCDERLQSRVGLLIAPKA